MAKFVPKLLLPNGHQMPILGFGTSKLKDEQTRILINTALERGYRHFDTAYHYGNENAIGDVLQDWMRSGRIAREEIFMTTKLPMIGNRADDVARFLDKSLENLKLTYLDLYLIHNPVGMKSKDDSVVYPRDADGNSILDYNTDHESVYKALEEQFDSGKTKAIGFSSFNSKQIERIMAACRLKPDCQQVEVHAYYQQKPLREVCERHGIPICAYAPLAAPYKVLGQFAKRTILLENPTVKSIADRLGKTPAQVLLRFLIQMRIASIPMSSSIERVQENFQVFNFELSSFDMAELEALDQGPKGKTFPIVDQFQGISRHPEFTYHIPF